MLPLPLPHPQVHPLSSVPAATPRPGDPATPQNLVLHMDQITPVTGHDHETEEVDKVMHEDEDHMHHIEEVSTHILNKCTPPTNFNHRAKPQQTLQTSTPGKGKGAYATP